MGKRRGKKNVGFKRGKTDRREEGKEDFQTTNKKGGASRVIRNCYKVSKLGSRARIIYEVRGTGKKVLRGAGRFFGVEDPPGVVPT